MENILSVNDVLWRTAHGYVGLRGLKENYYDDKLLADLKSVCCDVSGTHAIAKSTGLTFLKKDAIMGNELFEIKTKYKKIEVADSLMKYFKQKL